MVLFISTKVMLRTNQTIIYCLKDYNCDPKLYFKQFLWAASLQLSPFNERKNQHMLFFQFVAQKISDYVFMLYTVVLNQ